MFQVYAENVRCFREPICHQIRPITFLVGENSSGKSTFLALIRLAWDISNGISSPDFNEEPFQLGSFDQIATYFGGKAGRAKSFRIGLKSTLKRGPGKKNNSEIGVFATFVARGSQPGLWKWEYSFGEYSLSLTFDDSKISKLDLKAPSGVVQGLEIDFPRSLSFFKDPFSLLRILQFELFSLRNKNERRNKIPVNSISDKDIEELSELSFWGLESFGQRPYAFAPVRTKPQRTYDPLKDTPEPSGAHVPMILARTRESDTKVWNSMQSVIEAYGNASGLFKNLDIKRMGGKESDPFQISVQIFSPKYNLVDVGYGISQVLPIIVDSLLEKEDSTILLQQPEVHLHPKAQAELADVLALIAARQNKNIVIETHSDYIIDRMRTLVRQGQGIKPEDVLILYFERLAAGVKIHEITVDEMGNIHGAPEGYRQFFLDEEKRILGM
ncbi:MAG: hypothetical protein EPO32_10405 [Anaerolineae bacterium]|nr:MAG: hypothetical protein EPO32_10405 [Anaerolineae bacterium]